MQRYLSLTDEDDEVYAPTKELLGNWSQVLTRLSATTEEEDARRSEMVTLAMQYKTGKFVVRFFKEYSMHVGGALNRNYLTPKLLDWKTDELAMLTLILFFPFVYF